MLDATSIDRDARRGITYLTLVSLLTALTGVCFVLLPNAVYDGFGLMVYGSDGFPDTFGAEESAYIRLTHNVMGAVMAGWFVLAAWHVHNVLPRRIPGAWSALIGAFLLWFALDTAYSLQSGFWPNALLNGGFLLVFSPGFWLTRSLRTA